LLSPTLPSWGDASQGFFAFGKQCAARMLREQR
jgi:hypothetical protein